MSHQKITFTPTLLIGLMILVASCSTSRLSGDSQYAATFQSYPNGVADINLQLKPNMKFDYQMTILPQPGQADTLAEVFNYTGRWGNNESHYILRFRRYRKPDLVALAHPGYEPETSVTIKNERTLSFPIDDPEVVIWGVRCYKEN